METDFTQQAATPGFTPERERCSTRDVRGGMIALNVVVFIALFGGVIGAYHGLKLAFNF